MADFTISVSQAANTITVVPNAAMYVTQPYRDFRFTSDGVDITDKVTSITGQGSSATSIVFTFEEGYVDDTVTTQAIFARKDRIKGLALNTAGRSSGVGYAAEILSGTGFMNIDNDILPQFPDAKTAIGMIWSVNIQIVDIHSGVGMWDYQPLYDEIDAINAWNTANSASMKLGFRIQTRTFDNTDCPFPAHWVLSGAANSASVTGTYSTDNYPPCYEYTASGGGWQLCLWNGSGIGYLRNVYDRILTAIAAYDTNGVVIGINTSETSVGDPSSETHATYGDTVYSEATYDANLITLNTNLARYSRRITSLQELYFRTNYPTGIVDVGTSLSKFNVGLTSPDLFYPLTGGLSTMKAAYQSHIISGGIFDDEVAQANSIDAQHDSHEHPCSAGEGVCSTYDLHLIKLIEWAASRDTSNPFSSEGLGLMAIAALPDVPGNVHNPKISAGGTAWTWYGSGTVWYADTTGFTWGSDSVNHIYQWLRGTVGSVDGTGLIVTPSHAPNYNTIDLTVIPGTSTAMPIWNITQNTFGTITANDTTTFTADIDFDVADEWLINYPFMMTYVPYVDAGTITGLGRGEWTSDDGNDTIYLYGLDNKDPDNSDVQFNSSTLEVVAQAVYNSPFSGLSDPINWVNAATGMAMADGTASVIVAGTGSSKDVERDIPGDISTTIDS